MLKESIQSSHFLEHTNILARPISYDNVAKTLLKFYILAKLLQRYHSITIIRNIAKIFSCSKKYAALHYNYDFF